MDWTGGTRRRFAAGKNSSTVQKQKAHFAKARAVLYTLHTGVNRRRSPNHEITPFRSGPNRPIATREAKGPQNKHQHQPWGSKGPGYERSRRQSLDREANSYGSGLSEANTRDSVHLEDGHGLPSFAGPAHRQNSPRKTRSHLASSAADEERLLLARRRNLLARPDWLGLNVLRPAKEKNMAHSRASTDQRLVGRRRKVRKTRRHHQGTISPPVLQSIEPVPLFREDIGLGFDPDNFQIKIGTDAFGTQTQRSMRSAPSMNTSMRPPPTELSLLSEESMLLGPDDESFDLVASSPNHAGRPDCRSENPEIDLESQHPFFREDFLAAMYNEDFSRSNAPVQNENSEERGIDPYAEVLPQASPSEPFSPLIPEPHDHGDIHDQWSKEREGSSDQVVEGSIDDGNREALDEQDWRRFLEVKTDPTSHASMAAVDSSSLHQTDSYDVPRVALTGFEHAAGEEHEAPMVSTPRGVGTQGSKLVVHADNEFESEPGSGSPSLSLCRVKTLANAPPQPLALTRQEEVEQQDNELWKSYILGSENTSVASPPRERPIHDDPSFTIGTRSPPGAALSGVVSGLGTSIKSTFGESRYEMESTASVGAVTFDGSDHRSHPGQNLRQEERILNYPMARKSKETKGDQDINSPQAFPQAQTNNIHAGVHRRTLGRNKEGRRTSGQRKQEGDQRHDKPTRRELPKKRIPKRWQSVYDLVDSDDHSLA